MSTKILELLLQLTVKGQQEAQALATSVKELQTNVKNLAGLQQLDKLLNPAKAAADMDLLDKRIQQIQNRVKAGFAIKPDIDLSKVEAATSAARERARQLKEEITGAAARFDLVITKGRTLVDVITQAGRTKLDFNLDQIEREAARANAELQKLERNRAKDAMRELRTASQQAAQGLGQVQKQAIGVTDSLLTLTREAILVRRAMFALGFSFVAREALDVVVQLDKVRASLAAVFGESAVPAQLEFIRAQAERLGVGVADLADQWAKYSIATKNSKVNQQELLDTFLAVVEAGAKLSLSQDQINGALTALQQIASKGRLSLEELRQQLGDRLPGAIQIAAKGLKLTEAQLFSLIEAGQITADEFLKTFGPALRQTFNTDVNTRIQTTASELQRFRNALSDLVDEALRAGALDVFINVVKSLTELFRDPQTISNLKAISKGFAELIGFIKDNQEAIKALIIAYGAFKTLSFVGNVLTGIAAGLTAINVASKGVAVAQLASTATSLAAIGGTAGSVASATVAVRALGTALAGLVSSAAVPITIAIVGATAVRIATVEIAEALGNARERAQELNQALSESAGADAAARRLDATIDSLKRYSKFVIATGEDIKKMSEEALRAYNEQAVGAKRLADVVVGQTQLQIASLQAQIKALELLEKRTDAQIVALQGYREQLAELQKAQEKNRQQQAELAGTLKATEEAAKRAGVALDPYIKKLQDLARLLPGVKQSAEEINKLKFEDLPAEVQRLIEAFKAARAEGKAMGESIEKAFSADFADGSVDAISKVAQALLFLQQQGLATGKVINDELSKRLQKLTGEDLQKFQVNAKAAFEQGKISAEALATILKGSLSAALAKLGIDADDAGKKVSKGFKDVVAIFEAIATNAQATAAQIAAAFNKAIDTAKTREELLLLQQRLDALRKSGVASSKELADAQLRLQDRLRETAGVIDGALGDSFRRMGIESAARIRAFADQAVVDFNRIKDSGLANALEVEQAWRTMAEKVTAANNGIPPIDIVIQAVDFNAFDIIVKAAEDASARVRKAIQQAIPLVETEKQAIALGNAITAAFNKGKIAADEYKQLITQITFQTRELAAKTTGEVAAAAELLGVKSKAQLQAVAENARQAFDILLKSGQFTYQELSVAALKYLEAAKAANDGVAESFDSVALAAQEIIDKVNEGTQAINAQAVAAANLANTKMSEPVDVQGLGGRSISDLQLLLAETARSYAAIGVSNVENLQIIKDIQAEIARRSKEMADTQNNLTRQQPTQQPQTPQRAAPSGGSEGGVTININGSGLTVDQIRNQIVPYIRAEQRRTN